MKLKAVLQPTINLSAFITRVKGDEISVIGAFFSGLGLFILYYVVAVIVLIAAKILFKPSQELFRKLLHLACFMSVFVLHYAIDAWYIAMSVALAFALLLYPILYFAERFPKLMQLLQERKPGEIRSSLVLVFLMMALLIFVFWGWMGEEWKYISIVSVMAWGFGDGAAALIGKRFGRSVVRHRRVEGKKTLEGSIAMSVFAAAAIFVSLLFLTKTPWYFCLIAALCIAPICSAVELFSRNGTDTITVPLATAIPTFFLMKLFSLASH